MILFPATLTWGSQTSFLYLLPLVALGIGAVIYRYRWQRKTAKILESSPGLLHHFSLKKKLLKTVLLAASLSALALALARPQSTGKMETVEQEGRNVLIALDISRSMLAQDLTPSRLLAAKKKIKELVEELSAERVALMLFSDAPFVQCPFTSDMPAFLNFLDLVDVESISTGSTAFDSMLSHALDLFSHIPTSRNNILVVFTDGEDFSTTEIEGLIKKAQDRGLHIFTVGIGTTEGAPIPLYDEQGKQIGHQKDKNGSVVISRLHEELLRKLSVQTGAQFIASSQDSSDMQQLVSSIRRFEKEKFNSSEIEVKQEHYSPFALISLFFLLLEWIL